MGLPAISPERLRKVASWFGRTIDTLCDRPDHLQRLAIIGAGMFVYPMIWAFVLIAWLGFGQGQPVEIVKLQLMFIGSGMIGSLILWGLVVVTLLGTIKGVRVSGPGGVNLEFETSAGDGKGLAHAAPAMVGGVLQPAVIEGGGVIQSPAEGEITP